MKILILNCCYRDGSTGNIVGSIGDVLRAEGHEVLICYGLGNPYIDKYSKKVCTNLEHNLNALMMRLSGIPFGGLHFSNIRIKKNIRTFKPDVVNIHCMNASTVNLYTLLADLAKCDVKTVISLHAEIYHTAGCEHAFDCMKWVEGCNHCSVYKNSSRSWFFDTSGLAYSKMKKSMQSFNASNMIVTAVSPWLAERARLSSIMKGFRVVSVQNGVNTSVFHYLPNNGLIHKDNYQKVVLFVTAYLSSSESDIKGGRFLPIIAKALPDYKFVAVYSRTVDDVPVMPDNVELWGRANNQKELAQLYSEADVTMILSRRETFSMVVAESLCCGTPVVGFKAGGPESIALPEYSEFVDYGDVPQIVRALQFDKIKELEKNKISDRVSMAYSESMMAHRYCDLYKELCI